MKKNNFSKRVHKNLSSFKSMSLSMLLEEKEDLFDMPDEDEDKEEEAEESESLDSEVGDEESVSKEQFEELSNQLSAIKSTIDKAKQEDGTQSVESYISTAVANSVSVKESFSRFNKFLNKNKSIKRFIFEEKDSEDVEDVEADIDDLDRILSKGTDLVNKFKKGKEVNIEAYVDAAINAFRNFDSLFSKELIVKQATINVLVLNSGGKAPQNVKDFEEQFHEELHKQFGIEYEEHALITKNHNTATGAKSQG